MEEVDQYGEDDPIDIFSASKSQEEAKREADQIDVSVSGLVQLG